MNDDPGKAMMPTVRVDEHDAIPNHVRNPV
jgi:hypothetical protein